jgi:hypothetical protein
MTLSQHMLCPHTPSNASSKFALRLEGLCVKVRSWLGGVEAICEI